MRLDIEGAVAKGVEVLRLAPGDVLVVLAPDDISQEEASALRLGWMEALMAAKIENDVAVVVSSCDVKVLRPAEVDVAVTLEAPDCSGNLPSVDLPESLL